MCVVTEKGPAQNSVMTGEHHLPLPTAAISSASSSKVSIAWRGAWIPQSALQMAPTVAEMESGRKDTFLMNNVMMETQILEMVVDRSVE